MLQMWVSSINDGVYGIQNNGTRRNGRQHSSPTL